MNGRTKGILSADDVIQLLGSDDSFSLIERMSAFSDPLKAAELYAQAVMDAYWKKKDLHASVILGRAGIQHALSAATNNAEKAAALRGKAKAMAYNVASFTWPGWDEPGINCPPAMVEIGLDCARTNIRLAKELNKGDLPMSRGLWMLAGHQLARGEFEEAAKNYAAARDHAMIAASVGDEALCAGFLALTHLLQQPSDAAEAEMAQAITRLETAGDDGKEFIRQIEVARRVFEKAK
jgi:hypothetical protein